MRVFKFIAAVGLFAAPSFASAQFTLENEFKKQLKYHPGITVYQAPDSVPLAEIIDAEYAKAGDRSLTLDIFRPADGATNSKRNAKMPLLVFVHGGGWASGSKEMDRALAKAVAQHGIVTAAVDYRKSGEALYPAAVRDVKCALRYLRSRADELGIDTANITIEGTSAGGQMAALIGASNSDVDEFAAPKGAYDKPYDGFSSRVHRVIDIDGVLCFIHPDSSEGQSKPGKPSAADQWFGKTLTDAPELWDSASALYRVSRGSADFVFINSSLPRFSAGQAHIMRRLNAYGHTAVEHKTQGTPHTFWLFNPWAPDVVRIIVEAITKG